MIQTIAQNHKGGIDRMTNHYDFVGKVLQTKTTHTTTEETYTIKRRFVYDHAGRLLKTYHKLNDEDEVLLSQNEYNELGELIDKKLYSTDNGITFQQSVDYRYNIRGWLASVNNASLTNDGITNDDDNDYFGIQFGYNNSIGTGNTPQFNGNISAVKWSNYLGEGDVKERGYNYSYDAMNRLLNSTHQQKVSAWLPSNAYHENNTYDLNGNFKTIHRKGANGLVIDEMEYVYANSGNQPVSINDTGDQTKGFIDGNASGNDFAYDANGNTTIDKNAGITSAIEYNHLNLPAKVVNATTGEYIRNIYDATGRKLSQLTYTSADVLKKKLDYVGEFFYQNDSLKFINHEEGRVVMTGTQPEYQYFLKDHLGNNRVLFTTTNEHVTHTATLETVNEEEENENFLRYEHTRKVHAAIFDHTNGTNDGYALRLNGTANERYGLAKSLSVMPGDTIRMEVYAKYVDPNNTNWTTALTTLLSQIASGTAPAGTVVDGGSYSSSTASFDYGGLLNTSSSTGDGPKAYMNWLVFDRDFVMKNGGYVRMSDAAREYGQDVAHEKLEASFVINEPGYVYMYLSNEDEEPVEVYFDDWQVSHIKSAIVEINEYYPYGALLSTYQREGSVNNRWKYNNKELISDLNLGWLDYGARQRGGFDPRWRTIDPLSEQMRRWSPYNYAFDNPIRFIDPDGMAPNGMCGDRPCPEERPPANNGFLKSIGKGFRQLGQKLSDGDSYREAGKGFKKLSDETGLSALGTGLSNLSSGIRRKFGINTAGTGQSSDTRHLPPPAETTTTIDMDEVNVLEVAIGQQKTKASVPAKNKSGRTGGDSINDIGQGMTGDGDKEALGVFKEKALQKGDTADVRADVPPGTEFPGSHGREWKSIGPYRAVVIKEDTLKNQ